VTRFLDANVFIYAYYKPKGALSEEQKRMKEQAKKIIRRVNEGEEVVTTVVHLSEVANILKRGLPTRDLHALLLSLCSMDNVKVVGVTKEDYMEAIDMMKDIGLDPNDCLAVKIMRMERIEEIYSFDKAFDNVEGVRRATLQLENSSDT